MTSYGDVRQIIDDVVTIVQILKGAHNAVNELDELMREIKILSQLADDIQKNGSGFITNVNLQAVLKETIDCISELKKQLEKKQSTIRNFQERLRWKSQKKGIERDLEKARQLNELLSLLNTTISIRDLSDTQREEMVNSFIERWTPAMAAALREKAHQRVDVTKGTGEWILDEHEYKKWEQSRNGVLWINGLQGCGKTGLAITIDDRFKTISPFTAQLLRKDTGRWQRHRQEEQSPAPFCVATIFCYHQIDGMRCLTDHMEILMSLWEQLVNSNPECLPPLAKIKKCKTSPKYRNLTGQRRVAFQKELLQRALDHSGDTILIVDGLDEIPRQLQFELVKDLRSLQNDRCRILITSRPYESIARIFKKDPRVDMKAPDIDLKLYIKERFSTTNWDHHMDFEPDEIIDILLPKCRKSFLLTQLLMDEVVRADNKAHCQRIIAQLPSTVDEAYKRGLYRLIAEFSSEGLVDGLPCMAIRALFWVAFAKSPMTGDQLAHALAIADGNLDSDLKVKSWREHGIDRRTGKLVVLDSSTEELVIAHETLTKYLTKDDTRLEFFPSIREHMHEVQLECLLRNHNKSRVLGGTKEEFLEHFPLLTYALSNWGKGLENVLAKDTYLWKKTEAFLGTSFHEWNHFCKEEIVEVFVKKLGCQSDGHEIFTHDFFTPGSIEGLYWVVFFDLQKLVASWVDRSTDSLVKEPVPITPLGFAAALDNTSMMRLLLENNAQVNLTQQTNSFVKPPLHDAVYRDNAGPIEILLQSDADMTSRRGVNDKSPLDLVYDMDRERAVKAFASHISGSNGTRAQELQFLVRSGHTQRLTEAIKRGMDINHPCENGKRALDYAMEMGNEEIAKLLRNNGAVANLSWPAKKTKDCPYAVNLRDSRVAPLISKEKKYDTDAFSGYNSQIQDELILEIPIQTQQPVRSIVFETITADQGWSDYSELHDTYIGSNRSRLDVVLLNEGAPSESFVLQENLHASDVFRLHTNIWNLTELELSSPAKAQLVRYMKESTVLQIFARAWGQGWKNRVKYIRVRIYGEEIKPELWN